MKKITFTTIITLVTQFTVSVSRADSMQHCDMSSLYHTPPIIAHECSLRLSQYKLWSAQHPHVNDSLIHVTGVPREWGIIARCESGGNPKAVSPNGVYHGLYQFDHRTWKSNGGGVYAEDADGATANQQLVIAEVTRSRRGFQPWQCAAMHGIH